MSSISETSLPTLSRDSNPNRAKHVHLRPSTLLVLVAVVAVLGVANSSVFHPNISEFYLSYASNLDYGRLAHGFPCSFCFDVVCTGIKGNGFLDPVHRNWNILNLCLNVLFWTSAVFLSGYLWERALSFLARFRRKPHPKRV